MRTILLTALALALLSCRAPESFRTLPAPELDAWRECSPFMWRQLCSATSTRANCLRRRKGQFAEQGTSRERGMWLIRHGCPPPVIAKFYD